MLLWNNERQLPISLTLLAYLLLPLKLSILPCPAHFKKHQTGSELEEPYKVPELTPVKKKVVVVGGSGFIGARLVHALVLRGEEQVVVYDVERNDQLLTQHPEVVSFVQGDVRDSAALENAIDGAQVVFSVFSVLRYFEHLEMHYERSRSTNVGGIHNVIEACVKKNVARLILTSSSNACFSYEAGAVSFNDASPLCTETNAVSCYGRSKGEQEKIAIAANGKQGLVVAAIRPTSTVIGYKDKNILERFSKGGGIVPYFLDTLQDWVHVDDCVLAELLLEQELRKGLSSPAAGESFNIVPAASYTWSEFAKILQEESTKLQFKPRFRGLPLSERLGWLLAFFVEAVALVTGDARKVLGNDLGKLTVTTLVTTGLQPIHSTGRNDKARRLLGFDNICTTREAVNRSLQEFQNQKIKLLYE